MTFAALVWYDDTKNKKLVDKVLEAIGRFETHPQFGRTSPSFIQISANEPEDQIHDLIDYFSVAVSVVDTDDDDDDFAVFDAETTIEKRTSISIQLRHDVQLNNIWVG